MPPRSGEANEVLAVPGTTPVHRFAALLPVVTVNIRTGAPDTAMLRELGRLAHDLGEVQRLGAYANLRAEFLWLAGQQVTADAELSAIYTRTTSSGERTAATELAWWIHRAGLTVDPPSTRLGPFRDALADPRSAAAPLERLGSRYDAAVFLMDGNQEDVRQALEIFNRLGAKPAAAAAQATLRKLGASKIPRGPRPTTRRDPHGLTARQPRSRSGCSCPSAHRRPSRMSHPFEASRPTPRRRDPARVAAAIPPIWAPRSVEIAAVGRDLPRGHPAGAICIDRTIVHASRWRKYAPLGVTGVSVRTGSSFGMTGYDGQARGGAGTSFVPAGPGVWEFGTSGNPRRKAQSDYRDRTRDPTGIDPATTALIVVSLRKWDERDRQDWLTRRNKQEVSRIVVALSR
jgi:hypothetical protein